MSLLKKITNRSESDEDEKLYKIRHAMFTKNMKKAGLELRRYIPGDGNCLFHAVCDQARRLGLGRMRHTDLRQKTIAHLKENPYVVNVIYHLRF